MYVKYQMPLIAVSDVGRSKRFYCGLFDQRVVLDFGENVTFSGGFAIQEKFAWLTGLAEDSVRSRPNNMERIKKNHSSEYGQSARGGHFGS